MTRNFIFRAGADLNLSFKVSTVIDETTYFIFSYIGKNDDYNKPFEKLLTINNAETGSLSITLTYEETSVLVDDQKYEIIAINGNSKSIPVHGLLYLEK